VLLVTMVDPDNRIAQFIEDLYRFRTSISAINHFKYVEYLYLYENIIVCFRSLSLSSQPLRERNDCTRKTIARLASHSTTGKRSDCLVSVPLSLCCPPGRLVLV
jgi:hypothetical protein